MNTTANSELTATIPFQGFCDSVFDHMIDDTIKQMFNPASGYGDAPDGAHLLNHTKTFLMIAQEYAVAYIDELRAETGLALPSLKFESLDSPREYNFATDRVFISMSVTDAAELVTASQPTLSGLVREKFTSRSGFHSFYSNDVADWPADVAEWDHNQLGTALEACFDPDSEEQYYLVDDLRGNGLLDDAIHGLLPQSLQDLVEALHEGGRDYVTGEEIEAAA